MKFSEVHSADLSHTSLPAPIDETPTTNAEHKALASAFIQ